MAAGRSPPTGTVIVMRLPFGAYVGVRPVPATLAKIDCGSIPAPASEATKIRVPPRRTDREQAKPRRGVVADPVAEGERPGSRSGRAVEDDVIGAGGRADHGRDR